MVVRVVGVVRVVMVVVVVVVMTIAYLGLPGCKKESEPASIQPVAFFKIAPLSGNTTTIFGFDADSATSQGTRDNPVLVRWDWNSDGIWDRMYSTGGKITHRFFKPGSYTVIMEASTIDGNRDTMVISIEVPRGYSAPRANFIMTPDSANINTEFLFDASLSKDDEDSLDQLEFRWDLDGDKKWDTEFSKTTTVTHKYSDNYNYLIRLETRDPQQMTSIKTDTLIVTRLNDLIVPVVTHECWPCTVEDTVHFDASKTSYTGKPDVKLYYSWDVGNDNLWETTMSESPFYHNKIATEGKTALRLRVTDEQGLYMDCMDTVELFPFNSAPVTMLTIGNKIGNTRSKILLHTKGSTDRDDSIMDLMAHWDINNDGIWETEYDGLKEISITFPAPGKYPVTVSLTDPKNKTSTDTDTVWIVEGTHETGILKDQRGNWIPKYYGTVKVGNRWWMQSNLRFYPDGKTDLWKGAYYNNNATLGDRYGVLYPHMATYSNQPKACPDGWHVPTLDEWQQLMTDLGQDTTVARLIEGGRSEMHIILSGQKDSKFSGLGQSTNIWTSTVNRTGQAIAWYIDPIRKQNRSVIVGKSYWFPIRCIKDE